MLRRHRWLCFAISCLCTHRRDALACCGSRGLLFPTNPQQPLHSLKSLCCCTGIFHGDRASHHVYGSMDQGENIEVKGERALLCPTLCSRPTLALLVVARSACGVCRLVVRLLRCVLHRLGFYAFLPRVASRSQPLNLLLVLPRLQSRSTR
jgi:hypothetical protein